MAKDKRSPRNNKDDEANSSSKNLNGGKRSSLASRETTGLRRSTRETPSKKKNTPSHSVSRKSERLGKQTPATPPIKKKSDRIGKEVDPSSLRRSGRGNKFKSPGSSGSKKLERASVSIDLKQKDKKEKSIKELAQEAKEVPASGKNGSSKAGSKRKKRMDARSFRALFKPMTKRIKISDTRKQRILAGDIQDDSCKGQDRVFECVQDGQKELSYISGATLRVECSGQDGSDCGKELDSDLEESASKTLQTNGKVESSNSSQQHDSSKQLFERDDGDGLRVPKGGDPQVPSLSGAEAETKIAPDSQCCNTPLSDSIEAANTEEVQLESSIEKCQEHEMHLASNEKFDSNIGVECGSKKKRGNSMKQDTHSCPTDSMNNIFQNSISKTQERGKGSFVKLTRLPAGNSSGADSKYLNFVNKLREFWHKGHNALLIDEQDRIAKAVYFVLSVLCNATRPFLLITPCASLPSWEDEFLHLAPSTNVVAYGGNRQAREIVRSSEFYEEGGSMVLQVLLSSPEAISEDFEALKCIRWEAVIVDNCQNLDISANADCIKNLDADWRLLLAKDQIKASVTEYHNMLCLLNSDGNLVESEPHEAISGLKDSLSYFVVYARFVEYWVPVDISDVQLEQYCSTLLLSSIVLRSCSKSDPVCSLREILISTRKCCDHPYIIDPRLQESLTKDVPLAEILDVGIKASGKLLALDKMLSELKEQGLKSVILFQAIGGSPAHMGDILDDFLRQRFGPESYERIDGGGIVASKKQAAVNRFNKERGRFFFLLETRACFPSIKLSSVDAVIIYDSDWNPLNDLKALQKITIDSKLEQIKIFRLYSSCTVEERVLALARNDMAFDSTLQSINRSSAQSLLMWGASYLFKRLDEFHHDNAQESRANMVPKNPLLKDVLQEFLSLVQSNENVDSVKLISRAQQNGGSYIKNVSVLGEQKIKLEDGVPPHLFWTGLLEGRKPEWKYLPGASQRNRKRVQYFEEPINAELAKRRKKVDNNNVKSTSQPLRTDAGDTNVLGREGTPVNNDLQFLSKSNACLRSASTKSNGVISSIEASDVPCAPAAKMTESEDRRKMHDEQRSLLDLLKPDILRVCETLELPEDVKRLAARFLEYVVYNHRVMREPETILQAFQISVCWAAASLLNEKIDHKESLALVKHHLGFNCKEDEADSIYSKMRSLKKMFLLRSEDVKVLDAAHHSSVSNSILRNLDANSARRGVSYQNQVTVKLEQSHYSFGETLPPIEFTDMEIDVSSEINTIQKKFEKRKERLIQKQHEEIEKFDQLWETRIGNLEREHRVQSAIVHSIHTNTSVRLEKLKTLDDEYAKRRGVLEQEMADCRSDLEARHRTERNEEQQKLDQLLEQIKSQQQVESSVLASGEQARQSQTIQEIIPSQHPEGTAHVSENFLEQNSNTSTPTISGQMEYFRTLDSRMASAIDSSGVDKQGASCQNDTTQSQVQEIQVSKGAGLVDSFRLQARRNSLAMPIDVAVSHSLVQAVLHKLQPEPAEGIGQGTKQMDELASDRSAPLKTNQLLDCGVGTEMLGPAERTENTANQMNSLDGSIAVGTDQPNGSSTSVCHDPAEPQPSSMESSMTQPVVDPGHGTQLPTIEGHGAESDQQNNIRMRDQMEHRSGVPNIRLQNEAFSLQSPCAEAVASHLSRNESTTTKSPATPCSVSTSTITPLTSRYAGIQNGSSSQPVQGSAVRPSMDMNISRLEFQASTTRPLPANLDRHMHLPGQAVSRFPSSLPSDPLQSELERIHKETNQAVSAHEETKMRLKTECDKEIEDVVAQIRRKYDAKLEEAEASFLAKKKELDVNQKKVFMNKVLADAFRSKCIDYKASPELHRAMTSSYVEHLHQLHPPATRPASFAAASSGGLATISPPVSMPTIRTIDSSATQTRAPRINPAAPTAGNHQVLAEVRGPAPHLQPFRPSFPPTTVSGRHPLVASLASSEPARISQRLMPQLQLPPPPRQPLLEVRPTCSPSQPHPALHNFSIPAMELLRDIGSRVGAGITDAGLPTMPESVQNFESRDISEHGRSVSSSALPSSSTVASDHIVCLSDDE